MIYFNLVSKSKGFYISSLDFFFKFDDMPKCGIFYYLDHFHIATRDSHIPLNS